MILLAWFGSGFNFAKFADLLMVIAFGLAMETYYSAPLPGIAYRFSEPVTKEAQFPSNQIESDQADQISNAITTAEEQLGSPPRIFSFHEALTFSAVYTTLAFVAGATFLAGLRFLFMVSRSEQPDRKARPVKAGLSDAEEIRTWRNAGQIDVSPQYHNVIF